MRGDWEELRDIWSDGQNFWCGGIWDEWRDTIAAAAAAGREWIHQGYTVRRDLEASHCLWPQECAAISLARRRSSSMGPGGQEEFVSGRYMGAPSSGDCGRSASILNATSSDYSDSATEGTPFPLPLAQSHRLRRPQSEYVSIHNVRFLLSFAVWCWACWSRKSFLFIQDTRWWTWEPDSCNPKDFYFSATEFLQNRRPGRSHKQEERRRMELQKVGGETHSPEPHQPHWRRMGGWF